MFFQKMSVPVQSTVTVSSFLGMDRRARGELGSFREMENLTSDGYPTLTVRPRRGLAGRAESPGGIAAKDALIWVDGHTLYVGGVATELVLTEGNKQLIGMGSWLIVWPDKKYINTGNLSQHGSLENRVQTQGQVTLSLCGAKGTIWSRRSRRRTRREDACGWTPPGRYRCCGNTARAAGASGRIPI